MFASLAEKLQGTLKKLRGRGKLSEGDLDVALREIRLALLEADVNYRVVKEFTEAIRSRAVGHEVMKSITPGQQVVKIVHQEMTALLGQEKAALNFRSNGPTVVMLLGLQGAGKTTSALKLAVNQRSGGRKPLLVGADTYRPAAIKQLELMAQSASLSFFSDSSLDPVSICRSALGEARDNGLDMVIIDTAGRLHLDQPLMDELKAISAVVSPDEVMLVVDGMAGQDAVNSAKAFHDALPLSGIIMTKLDGDARGGAALSVYGVTGCPLKFIGVGEKPADFEPFHPDRMASRILGMGDVLSLVEKAEALIDMEQAKEMELKLRRQQFTLDDFRKQLLQVRSLGSMDDILNMLPGGAKISAELQQSARQDDNIKRIDAIISSMTVKEKENPSILDGSRRKRIARGSGTSVQEVNRLINQFGQMQKMLKQFDMKGGREKLLKVKKGKINFPF